MSVESAPDVLIVDDHPVVIGGLRCLLSDRRIGEVFEATNIVTAFRLFHKHRPAICVIDLSFENRDLSGLSLIRRIRALEPDTRILAFSMHDDPVIVSRALESGALGYVLKDSPAAVLLQAFQDVRAGRSHLEHRLAMRVATLDLPGRGASLGKLNARELQILTLLGNGSSYRVIADHLSVSYRTVIGACSSMRQKLGVRTLAELVHIAVSQNKLGSSM